MFQLSLLTLGLSFLAQLIPCSTLNIVFFVPTWSASNLIYDIRLGSTLVKAGHNVTFYLSPLVPGLDFDLIPPSIHRFEVPGIDQSLVAPYFEDVELDNIYSEEKLFTRQFVSFYTDWYGLIGDHCEAQVSNREAMARLKQHQFDVAFANMYELCPFGLIEMLEIPSTIWLSSTVLMEHMAELTGVPQHSTVFADFGDAMSFSERLQNLVGLTVFTPFFLHILDHTDVFRRHISPDFRNLKEIASERSQLVFANSVELLDFPRPILHKVIYIGGIGMRDAQPLTEEWESIVLRGQQGAVLVSFGSVAPSETMPQTWKDAILGLAKMFPMYQFIFRYTLKDLKNVPDNLHVSDWIPQSDLLGHPKVLAFVTHGGFNSFLESSFAGKPLVAVPLFGDQFRNARCGQRHGFALPVDKLKMSASELAGPLKTVLHQKKFTASAQRMSRMLHQRPFKGEELFVKWTEFAGEFQTLENMDPVSRKMNFVQLHNLDVIAFLGAVALLIFWVIFKAVSFLIGKCIGPSVTKKQKTS